jgi:hypothetical protein
MNPKLLLGLALVLSGHCFAAIIYHLQTTMEACGLQFVGKSFDARAHGKTLGISGGAIKQAPKHPELADTCRGNPGLKLRGKHGRFVTSTWSLKGPTYNNKSNPEPCSPSPVPFPAFPHPLASTDLKRKKAGPAASASSLFLPDLRRAEFDRLVEQMIQHFQGVSEMTPEQIKVVEGYFNCIGPVGSLTWTGFRDHRGHAAVPIAVIFPALRPVWQAWLLF